MAEYVRPPLTRQVFYDASGAMIDYGNRWRHRSPPEDSYSAVSNIERFTPVHTVADALVHYLRSNYQVTFKEDTEVVQDVVRPPHDAIRAVRVSPVNVDGAPITFVYTSNPGVVVHAGALQDFWIPGCGCDACDETAESCADELESLVLAVTEGGYSESVTSRSLLNLGLNVRFSIQHATGTRCHASSGEASPPSALRRLGSVCAICRTAGRPGRAVRQASDYSPRSFA